jgi:hypothetical protein
MSIASIILGGVLTRYPDLKIVVAERDINWISQFQQDMLELTDIDPLPFFKKNFWFTTEPESISKALKQMNPEQPQPSPREVGTAVERMGLREYSQEKPLSSVGAQIVGAMTPSLLTKKPMVTSLPAQVGLASAAGATAGTGVIFTGTGVLFTGTGVLVTSPLALADRNSATRSDFSTLPS